jgi:hypothetical protein
MFSILNLFKKQKIKTQEQVNLEQGLEKWKYMKYVSATFIDMLVKT